MIKSISLAPWTNNNNKTEQVLISKCLGGLGGHIDGFHCVLRPSLLQPSWLGRNHDYNQFVVYWGVQSGHPARQVDFTTNTGNHGCNWPDCPDTAWIDMATRDIATFSFLLCPEGWSVCVIRPPPSLKPAGWVTPLLKCRPSLLGPKRCPWMQASLR